jgi:hypothetical protein
MPDSSKLTIKPIMFNVTKATSLAFLTQSDMVNNLEEAPVNDVPYVVKGVKYGRPSFRLKRRGGDGFPESDAFWFTKDEASGKIVLNCIVEVFRNEPDVLPLTIKNTSIELEYNSGTGKVVRQFKITQSPFIKQTNILQDIHAELEVNEQEIVNLTNVLTDLSKAPVLKIKSELWWKRATPDKQGNTENTATPTPVITRRSFNYNNLKLSGTDILDERGSVLWKCKDLSEAQWGLNIIKRYKFDSEISIGKGKPFRYFLSGGKIPVGPKFPGEDFLPFDTQKVTVSKINNRWIITDGRQSMVNFDDDEASAREALKVLKLNGADGIGYMKRPRATFMYIKATKASPVFITLPERQMKMSLLSTLQTASTSASTSATAAKAKATTGTASIKSVSAATAHLTTVVAMPQASSQPQKLDLEHSIVLHYQKDDSAVFGDITEQYEVKDFKWRHESIIKSEMHTIYYRPTARPDTFYFLPQVFRIRVNEYSGEPKISIIMIPGANPDLIEQYRIIVNLQIVPYFNPRAKKDLFRTLDNISGGKIKYCNLSLGGFTSAAFDLRPEYSGENAVFRGKVSEKIESIDPVNGFNLSVDCTLESFDFFKRELVNGFTIGDIIFNLVEEKEDGEIITSSPPIPVELDIQKLGGIRVGAEVISNNEMEASFPKGVRLFNRNDFPVTVQGTELTLLAEIGSTIYDADYDIGNDARWPVILTGKNGSSQDVLLNQADVANLSEEDRYWTKLICEPYGVTLNTESMTVLERLIDHASGDPQIWELRVGCPVLERWDDLDESILEPFKLLDKVEIEVKNDTGKTWGIVLTKSSPFHIVQMARSISDILKTQQIDSRKYQYRLRTHYILQKTNWSEWQEPDSTAANFLDVQLQTLTN